MSTLEHRGTDAAIHEYIETVKVKAEQMVKNEFPHKILRLNDLLQKLNFHSRKMSEVYQDVNVPVPPPLGIEEQKAAKRRRTEPIMRSATMEWAKVYTLPNGPAPCNKPICELIYVVKPYCRGLVEDTNLLKLWISYLIPKIEDGNNFGVSIQGRTLKEIQLSEAKAEEFLEHISDYFVTRAKIVSKVVKYPHIDDYRRAVRELDEKQYLSLWLIMCEVRNRYCVVHDIVTKNIDKIKRPRTTNTDTLY